MTTPTIFFASSIAAIPIAAVLAHRINEHIVATCRLWWRVIRAGQFTLQGLIGECQQADFAIIILTADNVLVNVEERSVAIGPRDNCVFEAGLFMGALGADPERCFLVVDSVIDGDLLSDVKGITYLSLNVPREFFKQCKEFTLAHFREQSKTPESIDLPNDLSHSLDEVVENIVNAMGERTLYTKLVQDHRLPHVPRTMLVAAEKLVADGDLEPNDRVLVMAKEPLELMPDIANQVMANMKAEVHYDYVFHANVNLAQRYARFVQLMVTCGVIGGDSTGARKKNMANANATVNENTATMKEYLRIFFLPCLPGIELCIHNVTDPDKAECYLRDPGDKAKFVAWCRGEKAREIGAQMLDQFSTPTPPAQNHIIVFGTKDDDCKESLKAALRKLIHSNFQDDVERLLFG